MNRLLTIWGETLDRERPLQEYPRPQMQRESYLNLNGVWSYAIRPGDQVPLRYDGEIVVPFAPECVLSGVERQLQPGETLWYERKVTLPEGFRGESESFRRDYRDGEWVETSEGMQPDRVLLHFGAVDQVADVYWNGVHVAHHEGGYLPFTADVTNALCEGENVLCVKVTDSLINTPHGYGKQKYKRGGIWYTATSGIWQTVWMESVPQNYIESVELTPDFDMHRIYWRIRSPKPMTAKVVVKVNGQCIAEDWEEENGKGWSLILPEYFRPWSPEDPYLYDLEITMGSDTVKSYVAMRKFGTVEHEGHKVLALNGKPYFHNGLLDQGYWSDGMYTAPSDGAMLYDISTMKSLGFNMLRKHIKIEPLRWYYHCDRLGMLVWQDMVSGGAPYNPLIISTPLVTGIHLRDNKYRAFGRDNDAGRIQFEEDMEATVKHLYNCPCIALWVPFNEGWGQFDALRITIALRRLDSTRLVDHASGWHDQGGGDLRSYHIYFKPLKMKNDGRRALALTEFGGYSLPVEGHIHGKKFGYRVYKKTEDWMNAYVKLYENELIPLIKSEGLSAAVYTELSDVEDEINGLLTYDRRVLKADGETIRALNRKVHFDPID